MVEMSEILWKVVKSDFNCKLVCMNELGGKYFMKFLTELFKLIQILINHLSTV